MKTRLIGLSLVLILVFTFTTSALAQTYFFSVDKTVVNLFMNEDGTVSLDYVMTFSNSPSADPIDFVDIGLPNPYYDSSSISADVNGVKLTDIEDSPYVEYGVAVGLGSNAIRPGQTGTLHVYVATIRDMFFQDDQDSNYASMQFIPNYFGSEFVYGSTDLQVTFHFPAGVGPEEPRWHSAPSGFPSEPVTGFDDQGRITYLWQNSSADSSSRYRFGASFPRQYVPAETVSTPTMTDRYQVSEDTLIMLFVCGGFSLFFFGSIALAIYAGRKRQMQYLPPRISIEGHGIKRGLTAIEAAILMEQPMDKVLTMILFAVLKKGAAQVIKRDPLDIDTIKPLPDDLRDYEIAFLKAFESKNKRERQKDLQTVMIELVRSVSSKMKGFSRRETIAYYKDIMRKAWTQVEASETPEVKSEKYDEVMEWTMLDRDYEGRTREVFRSGPVFVPVWWGRYDPTFGRSGGSVAAPVSTGKSSSGGGGLSMPTLPGADFAAGMIGGVQNFSSSVIGNLSEFTKSITNRTNPVPKSTSSGRGFSGGGGGGCACACACAGCACACAGGGR